MADAEIALINKVELRLALADTDERLSTLLGVYLAPLLLKLTSPHQAVRAKVIEVCQHVNSRVRSGSVPLPLDALLTQFHEAGFADDTAAMKTFDLMYVQIALQSVTDLQEIRQLLPQMVRGIASQSPTHASSQFFLFLSLLNKWSPPPRGTIESDALKDLLDPGDQVFLTDKFIDLFNLDLTVFDTAPTPIDSRTGIFPDMACDGLTPESFKFLTRNQKGRLTEQFVSQSRGNVVKFMLTAAITDELKFIPLLVASHCRSNTTSEAADDGLRRILGDKSLSSKLLEDPHCIDTLYVLALGDLPTKRQPVNSQILAHILQLLARSQYALNKQPEKLISAGFASDNNIKSSRAAIELIRAVSRTSSDSIIQDLAAELVSKVRSWIEASGWPNGRADAHNSTLRRLAYESLGVLLRRAPKLLESGDLSIIQFLFASLEGDARDFKPSIQEALSEIIPILPTLSEKSRDLLLNEILAPCIVDPQGDQTSKYVAIRYVARAMPFDNSKGRFLCLLALQRDNRPDVIEEAKRGLHPYWYQTVTSAGSADEPRPLEFPSFKDMIDLVSSRLGEPEQTVPTYVLDQALLFVEQVFTMEAVKGHKTVLAADENWDSNLQNALLVDDNVRGLVRAHLADTEIAPSITKFLNLAYWAMSNATSQITESPDIWLRTLSQCPPNIVKNFDFSSTIEHMAGLVVATSTSPRLTRIVSNGLAIIATQALNASDLSAFIDKFLVQSHSASHKLYSNIYALGSLLSHVQLRGNINSIPPEQLSKATTAVADIVKDTRDAIVLDAALDSIAQMFFAGVPFTTDLAPVKQRFVTLAKGDNEKALFALGCLAITSSTEERRTLVDDILELHSSKHVDFMFISGEALCIAAAGWDSQLAERYRDIQGVELTVPTYKESILDTVLDLIIAKCRSAKPALRRFSCFWLLSVVQYCGHLEATQNRLEQIHLCFMRFLVDRDDAVQDASSRGLSVVYEKAGPVLKDNMIRGLVQSFTSESKLNKSVAGTVTEETQLFEPGVLDTGEGSISTYKDILSLASEVGDPSLVYKFMALAAHSTLWQSRKGAAFGLGSLLSKANVEDLFANDPRLSKSLIPKLYRYRFDPSRAVQESMRGIWSAIVKDDNKIVNNNFDDIVEELLTGMGNREWRVRQASTAALAELLVGKLVEQYEKYLQRIWLMSFRVVDDIKDSVREVGMQLTRGLINTSVRNVDVHTGASPKRAEAILKDLIPFLMGLTGIQSGSQEVQSFSLDALLKLCKSDTPPLRPYIPGLIEELLDMLSTLEPQAMNYLALNAEKYGLASSDVDASRMSSLRGSPMMETVEQMVDRLDESLLQDLVPRLCNVIRKSVGLPSKLGTSRIVVGLVMRNINQLRPFADTLLVACSSQLMDRNVLVSQSYAVSCGYLCRAASNKAVLAYIEYLQKLYFDSFDTGERARRVSSTAVNAISKHSADKFSSVSAALLPFVFVAKFDPDSEVKAGFDMTWSDNTGGSGAIKLHLKEILDLAKQHLGSNQWDIRQVAARSVAEAAVLVGADGADGSAVSRDTTDELFAVLIQACSGRSWAGKEAIVSALVSLAVGVRELLAQNEALRSKIEQTLVTEAKRRNKVYQVEAVQSLGRYIGALEDSEALYEGLWEIADSYFGEEESSDVDDDGDVEMAGDGSKKETSRIKLLDALSSSVVYTPSKSTSTPTSQAPDGVVAKTVAYYVQALDNKNGPVSWKSELAVCKHTLVLCTALGEGRRQSEFGKLWTTIAATGARNASHEKVRIESAKALGALVKLVPEEMIPSIREEIDKLTNTERSSLVKTELANVTA